MKKHHTESREEKISELREEKKTKIRGKNGKTGFDQINANIKTESAASSTEFTATVSNITQKCGRKPYQ
jgi:hypothetical protein